ncbi:MAG: YeeE/YedE family protein [Rhizobiales bacterium]|nr:YeeE/YedE family protein [Hyphomicrobiales bacterium]
MEMVARIIAPLLCGLVFGMGLLISGMVQPTKVLGFLDVLGAWDPSLAVVMAAALAAAAPGFLLARRRAGPVLAGQYFWPEKSGIDAPLVLGAGLFGVGWGLAGLCPGPALESLATLSPGVIAFVAAMAAGMVLHDNWRVSRPVVRHDEPIARVADG